jgi:hypothetical protein
MLKKYYSNATHPKPCGSVGKGDTKWGAAMKLLKRPLRISLLVAAALQLAACSKTVQWEEEVPLNTGETIWVKRSGTYTYRCEFAVGTGCGYAPDWRSTIEFSYKGKKYSYTSEASPMVLAISPAGQPNLIALADQADWGNKNKYSCDAPYYVQFQPSENGRKWTWPNKIEKWLYNLPTNLVIGLMPLESDGQKVFPPNREQENASATTGFVFYRRIDPTYSSQHCVRSK